MVGRRVRALIVPALYAVAALATFRDYGLTWDEGVGQHYGELALDWFRGNGDAVNRFLDLRHYGALFEMIAAAFAKVAPMPWYDARHLCVVATGVLAVLGTGVFAEMCGAEAWLAQLALVLMPQFWGHAFNNGKDVPFACAVAWMFVAFASQRRLAPGIAFGLALSVRVGAVIPFGIGSLALATREVEDRQSCLSHPPGQAGLPVLHFVIGWLLMLATWPWAQTNPFVHPLESLAFALRFPTSYPVLFEGHVYSSAALPRRYLLEMLAITTPIATLALAIAGLALIRWKKTPERILLLWLAVPILGFLITKPNVYDGIRHFLFLLPAIAVAAAIALQRLPRPAVIVLAIPLVAMVRLHPYETTYLNAFADPSKYESDYWASSYREAALWLKEHKVPGRPTRVVVAATPLSEPCLTAYLDDGFEVVRTTKQTNVPFDYYVATTRYRLDRLYATAPVVETIGRGGVAYAVIRAAHRGDDERPPAAGPTGPGPG